MRGELEGADPTVGDPEHPERSLGQVVLRAHACENLLQRALRYGFRGARIHLDPWLAKTGKPPTFPLILA